MNRSAAGRLMSGVVLVEIIVVVLLLFIQTCCPAGLDRLASASEGAELVLFQPADDVGPNPFVDVADREAEGRTGVITMTASPDGPVGTYGGTKENTCDPELLVKFLTQINPAKGRAWATAQGINFNDIASFVATLTPTVLQKDTKITNYGYKNGLTSNPSVLAKGTAVLVDANGVMRVRCMCGNPIGIVIPPPPPPPPPCDGEVEVFGYFDGEPTLLSAGMFNVKDLKLSPFASGAFLFYQQVLVILPNGNEGLVDPKQWVGLEGDCSFPPITVCASNDIFDEGESQSLLFSKGQFFDVVLAPSPPSTPSTPLYIFQDGTTSSATTSTYFDIATVVGLVGTDWQCDDPPPECSGEIVVFETVGDMLTGNSLGFYSPYQMAQIIGNSATFLNTQQIPVAVTPQSGPPNVTGSVTVQSLLENGCTFLPIPVCSTQDLVDDDETGSLLISAGTQVRIVPVPAPLSTPTDPLFYLETLTTPAQGSQIYDLPTLLTVIGPDNGACETEIPPPPPECQVTEGAELLAGGDVSAPSTLWTLEATDTIDVPLDINALSNRFIRVSRVTGEGGYAPLDSFEGLCLPIIPICVEDGPVTLELAQVAGTKVGPLEVLEIGPSVTQINGVPHVLVNFLANTDVGFLRYDVIRDLSACGPGVIDTTTTSSSTTTTSSSTTSTIPRVDETTTTSSSTTSTSTTSTTSTIATTIATTIPAPTPCEFTNNMYAEASIAGGEIVTSGGSWTEISLTGETTTDPETGRRMAFGTAVVGGGATRTGWVFIDSLRGECPPEVFG